MIEAVHFLLYTNCKTLQLTKVAHREFPNTKKLSCAIQYFALPNLDQNSSIFKKI